MHRVVAAALLALCLTSPGQAQPPEPVTPSDPALVAGLLSKSLCSGLWVNRRERDDFLAHDIIMGRESLDAFRLDVDAERGAVTATGVGVTRSAVFHAGHGCTILPEGEHDVFFTPVPIRPAVPDPALTAWPMGDVAPRTPLPPGFDTARLEAALAHAFSDPELVTRAVVVIHAGRLVAERYADGFDASSVMIGWSMGKSVTAALVGVLVERGWLDVSAPAPIAEWGRPGDPRGAIALRDLLQMSSGLRFDRIEMDEPGFFSRANHHFAVYFEGIDVFRWASERPLEHAPGTLGRYRNSDPLSLGRILRETVEAHGEDYLSFPQRALFDRIGARSFVLERDPWGNAILTGFDHATPRDYARFGLLFLQDGVFDGQRVLPEGWAELVSTPAPGWPERNYGGQFWVNGDGGFAGVPRDSYMARGAFGQHTVIVPSAELVVVRMGYSDSPKLRANVAELLVGLIEAVRGAQRPAR